MFERRLFGSLTMPGSGVTTGSQNQATSFAGAEFSKPLDWRVRFLTVLGVLLASAAANRLPGQGVAGSISSSLGSSPVLQATAATSVTFSGLPSAASSFAMAYGSEFTVNAAGCSSGSTPSCPVTFTPHAVGLRRDALLAKDGTGNIIGEQDVYGIGQGAVNVVTPGVISSLNLSAAGAVSPSAIAFDPGGNTYLADSAGNRIIKVDTAGNAVTFALSGETLSNPTGVVADGAGNLYIVDSGNDRIVEVSPSGAATALGLSVSLSSPTGIAMAVGRFTCPTRATGG